MAYGEEDLLQAAAVEVEVAKAQRRLLRLQRQAQLKVASK